MIYTIDVIGEKVVQTKFERMGMAAVSARPAMVKVAAIMMQIMAAVFNSQGRRGGGSWARDSDEWLARKVRNGLDPRIMHATLALRNAMSEPEAAHQILAITDHSVTLGTDLPYARRVNRDRPFITKFTKVDRYRMRRVVREHLLAAWRMA